MSLTRATSDRFLVFSLGTEIYGMPLSKVKEVIGLSAITPVPGSASHFKGIMDLRGEVISIIDLGLKLKIPVQPKSEKAIVILDIKSHSIGVIVDNVDSVLAVQPSDLQAPPTVESQMKIDSIVGVIRNAQKLIIVLDVEKALGAADLKTTKQAQPTGQPEKVA